MKCNVCGAEIPAGAVSCPVCGAPAPAAGASQGGYSMAGGNAAPSNPFGADPANVEVQQAAQQAAQNYGGYDPNPQVNPYADPYGAPQAPASTPAPVAPKSSHTGLIIGIIAGVAVVAALVIMWVLGVFGGGGQDGTYKLNSAKMYGQEITEDQLATFGLDTSKFAIKVSGSTATLSMAGQESKCDVKFSGSTVTFTGGGQSISGTYDEGAGKITISYSGVEMTFKK